MSGGNELVVLLCRVYRSTDKAHLIGEPGLLDSDTDQMEWLPESLIMHRKDLPGNKVELEIPRWLANQRELDYLEKD